MSEDQLPNLEAVLRQGAGKGEQRPARRDGMVPGIVYGGGEDPIAINIPFNVLFKKLSAGRFLSTPFNLKVDGQDDVRVICRNVQRDVVKDLPTHLDLMRLKRTTKINLFIPVEFANEDAAPGLKKGGILSVVRPEVELVVTAGDIPEEITVDLTGLEIGDTIMISSVDLPSGVKPTIERDFVIAKISAPSGLLYDGDVELNSEAFFERAREAWGKMPARDLSLRLARAIFSLPSRDAQKMTVGDISELIQGGASEAQVLSAITTLTASTLPILSVHGRYTNEDDVFDLSESDFQNVIKHNILFRPDSDERIDDPQKFVHVVFSLMESDEIFSSMIDGNVENV